METFQELCKVKENDEVRVNVSDLERISRLWSIILLQRPPNVDTLMTRTFVPCISEFRLRQLTNGLLHVYLYSGG